MTVKELLILLAESDINANISINTGENINEEVKSIDIWTDEYFKKCRQESDTNV